MKEIILDYIRKNSGTSYAELERVFEEHGFEYEGEIASCNCENENVIFWSGWSEQTFDIIGELIKQNLIERVPCSQLVYLIDGKCLTYPLVKGARAYKTPHWLPCVLNAK